MNQVYKPEINELLEQLVPIVGRVQADEEGVRAILVERGFLKPLCLSCLGMVEGPQDFGKRVPVLARCFNRRSRGRG